MIHEIHGGSMGGGGKFICCNLFNLVQSRLLDIWGAVIIMVYMDLVHLLSIYGSKMGFGLESISAA